MYHKGDICGVEESAIHKFAFSAEIFDNTFFFELCAVFDF